MCQYLITLAGNHPRSHLLTILRHILGYILVDISLLEITNKTTEKVSIHHSTWMENSFLCFTPFPIVWSPDPQHGRQGRRKDWGGPGQRQKVGPHKMDCVRGSGARPQEILRFYMLWSVFWGFMRLFFVHAHSTYNTTCKLPFSISGFRSISTTYGALASGLHSSHVR